MPKKKVKSGLRALAVMGAWKGNVASMLFGRKKKFGKAYPIKQRKVTKEERKRILEKAKKVQPALKDRKKTLREMRTAEAKRMKEAAGQ